MKKVMKTKHVLLIIMGFGLFLSCQDDFENSEKKDDSVISKAVFSGYVQKGPFINGSSVTISELDENLDQTGKTYFTTIANNLGSFEKKNIELISNYVALKADGYYFNEISGETSTGQITLYALVDMEDMNSANVNVLTHLERARVEYLVQQESLSFAEAKQQARKEVMAIFGFSIPEATIFESLDLTSDAALLAISCILQGSFSTGDMAELMADIITDIRNDGILDNADLKIKLIDNAISMSFSTIRDNMTSKYAELGMNVSIPDFQSYVKLFIENNVDPTAVITYPKTGMYGINILSDEVTSVTKMSGGEMSPFYSMAADVPIGMSLKIVMKNGPKLDTSGSWCPWWGPHLNWQEGQLVNDHVNQWQEFTATSRKPNDLKLGFQSRKVDDDLQYITVEYYENGSITPTKIKRIYLEEPES